VRSSRRGAKLLSALVAARRCSFGAGAEAQGDIRGFMDTGNKR